MFARPDARFQVKTSKGINGSAWDCDIVIIRDFTEDIKVFYTDCLHLILAIICNSRGPASSCSDRAACCSDGAACCSDGARCCLLGLSCSIPVSLMLRISYERRHFVSLSVYLALSVCVVTFSLCVLFSLSIHTTSGLLIAVQVLLLERLF